MNKKSTQRIPLVSIICAAYNHELYINQCLDGFVMQKTNFPFEIIISDDASADNTAKIIKEYELKYPELFKCFYHKENLYSQKIDFSDEIYGNVKGKYIALCEGDDYWIDPNKLQKQIDFLETNVEYGLVFTDVNFYYQDKDKIIKSVFNNGIIKHKINFYWQLIHTGYFAPCTWVCRREYLPNFEDKVYVDGTFPWLLDIMANSKVYFLPETTSVYRVLPESASRSKDENKNFKFMEGVYQIQLDYAKKYNVEKSILSIIEQRHYYNLLVISIKYEKNDLLNECQKYYSKIQPNNVKARIVFNLSKSSTGRKLLKNLYQIKHQ